ncbi:MAG TPA: Gfo/Idh/MocA family oxidoreductase, partial [Puia sp.]|nr:Gfo/Idh/MocA family oxidoreductase [Puia sp.]
MPLKPRRIILIGAGGIVKGAHLPAYRKAGWLVSGIYDLDKAKAQALALEFGIEKVFGTLEEAAAVSASEIVYDVAVPAAALREVVEKLPDGSVVLMQKPM